MKSRRLGWLKRYGGFCGSDSATVRWRLGSWVCSTRSFKPSTGLKMLFPFCLPVLKIDRRRAFLRSKSTTMVRSPAAASVLAKFIVTVDFDLKGASAVDLE